LKIFNDHPPAAAEALQTTTVTNCAGRKDIIHRAITMGSRAFHSLSPQNTLLKNGKKLQPMALKNDLSLSLIFPPH
jgi:hypothetical protein